MTTMTDTSFLPPETWLGGNQRPVVWLAGAGLVVTALILAAAAYARLPLAVWAAIAVLSLVFAVAVILMARAAARPRLERRGDVLRIRLSPSVTEDVPLDVVECFFPGSNPITRSGEPTCGSQAAFRVNTLVMRLAERAVDQAARPTFTPWGTWDDGYVIFDGRWCEPLSPDLARTLGRRLIEAKRSLAGDRDAGPA
jgi:hypothetical protein